MIYAAISVVSACAPYLGLVDLSRAPSHPENPPKPPEPPEQYSLIPAVPTFRVSGGVPCPWGAQPHRRAEHPSHPEPLRVANVL